MSAAATMMIAPVLCNDACEIRCCASVSISPVIVRIPTLYNCQTLSREVATLGSVN